MNFRKKCLFGSPAKFQQWTVFRIEDYHLKGATKSSTASAIRYLTGVRAAESPTGSVSGYFISCCRVAD